MNPYAGSMRWLPILLTLSAFGQELRIEPAAAPQGGVFRIDAPGTALSARFQDRIIPLFPQPDGRRFGLMPVAALTRPGLSKLEILGAGDQTLASENVTVVDAHFKQQNVHLTHRLSRVKPSPGELVKVGRFRQGLSPVRYWREPFDLPIPGCETSPFGVQRIYNGKPSGNYHSGIDQRGPHGEPIHAIASGTVRLTGHFNLHGNVVGVDHGEGLSSIYLHMSRIAVRDGETVKKGEVLGYVGSTGRSTAPHLHWSMYVNGVPVNPALWVALTPCPAAPPVQKRRRRPVPKKSAATMSIGSQNT